MSMTVLREWEVRCDCPECGEPMSPMVTLQENQYPESHNMPEHVYLQPSMILNGVDRTFCHRCMKAYDPRQLQPVLVQIAPKS